MKRMFTKSKTKADILSMLDRMIAQHGDAMSIPMLRVDQSDHLKLYTCALTTGFLQAMICRLPRSLENPEGIQRAVRHRPDYQRHHDEARQVAAQRGQHNDLTAVPLALASPPGRCG